MDIYCPKCAEPWDSLNLRIHEKDCEDCKGTGRVRERSPIELYPNEHPIICAGIDESSGVEDCACQHEKDCEDCDGTGTCSIDMCDEHDDGKDDNDDGEAPCHNPECDEGRVKPDCTWSTPCDDGFYYPHCSGCQIELEAFNYGEGNAVIGDGEYYCLECAAKDPDPLISWYSECADCHGKGKIEHGGDALEPDEIRRFKNKEGCPSCDWGKWTVMLGMPWYGQ